MNKFYNIVVYAHLVLDRLEEILGEMNYRDTIDNFFDRDIPDYVIDYLEEKSQKYLGVAYHDIDHKKLIEVMYGSLIVGEARDILPVFSKVWDRVCDDKYVDIDIQTIPYDHTTIYVHGISTPSLTQNIKDYILTYNDSEVKSLIRDMNIDMIL